MPAISMLDFRLLTLRLSMIIYEVNLEIDQSIYADYIPWLDQHIQDILSLPGFTKALLVQDQDSNNKISVQYYLESETSLDNYLKNHAPQMRADGINKFQGKFTTNRRVLKINRTYATG